MHQLTRAIRNLIILAGLAQMITMSASPKAVAIEAINLERSVCLLEPLVFAMWRTAAGRPQMPNVAEELNRNDGSARIERKSYLTADGRMLWGFRIRATGPARAFLLVALGNAMLSEQVVGVFHGLRSKDIDIYLMDYRGYGRSEGKTRLKALIHDYGKAFSDVSADGYHHGLALGISMGGVIVTNGLLAQGISATGIVIDGTPSTLPRLLCPRTYDPATVVANTTAPTEGLMVISGGSDQVVARAWMEPLIRVTQQRGGSVILEDGYAHPFMEPANTVFERLGRIMHFLEKRMSARNP